MTLFTLAGLVVRITFVLAVGFAALALTKRQSASMRHAIAFGALLAALAVPAAVAFLPRWTPRPATPVVGRIANVSAIDDALASRVIEHPLTAIPVAAAARSMVRWNGSDVAFAAVTALWLAGVLAVALVCLDGWRITRRTVARSRPATASVEGLARELLQCIDARRRRVPVLVNVAVSVPFAAGFRKPVIVLPAGADAWANQRTRAVLAHELWHVARADCVTEYAMWLVCAVYWFHPMAWRMAARVRLERERCCDDLVLSLGTPAEEYADQLVDFARAVRDVRWRPAAALAMASCAPLERRVQEILDTSRNRRPITFARRFVVQLCVPALVIPLAGFRISTHQAALATITGALRDTAEYALQPGVPVAWHGGIDHGATLSIRSGMGDVVVDSGASGDVQITVQRKAGPRGVAADTRFAVMRSIDGLTVCAVYVDPTRGRSRCEADGDWGRVNIEDNVVDFHVSLPYGVHLRVQAGNGDVNVTVLGHVHILDGNGKVRVATNGAADITTYTGGIEFDRLSGGESWPVSLRVLHGGIVARIPGGGDLDVRSDTGAIRIDGPGNARLEREGRYVGRVLTSPAPFVAHIQKGDISISVP